MMQIKEGESYEEWADRVHKFEYGFALQRIAKGDDTNEILEQMSKRIMNKMLYPVVSAIRNTKTEFDAEASRKSYEENYLKKNGRKSDHVLE